MPPTRFDTEEITEAQIEDQTDEPPMYRVYLLNDDYTTMEFVVHVLMVVFKKSPEEATAIMWKIHKTGSGLCGVYTYEVAETKVNTVHMLAREHQYPLKCFMEKE